MDLDKDDYQKVVCNNEHCPYSTWMHLQCFYEWESSILVQFNCIGRARSWNEKQCRQNMWTKKGYDLAFRFCSCRCGQGHLKKDTDWYQVKRMQDEKKKKAGSEKNTGRPSGEAVLLRILFLSHSSWASSSVQGLNFPGCVATHLYFVSSSFDSFVLSFSTSVVHRHFQFSKSKIRPAQSCHGANHVCCPSAFAHPQH